MTAAASDRASRTLTSDAQLIQDYLQSAGILVSTADDGAGKIAAFQNPEGQAEAIVIGLQGNLFHACREPMSDSGWNMYGIGSGFQAIAAVDGATFWAAGNDGALWRQDHARWTHTQKLPNGGSTVGTSVGSDGTVWAMDGDHDTLFVKGAALGQTPPQVEPSIAPVLTMDSSDLLNFFCIDTSGALWTIRQTTSGGIWGTWRNLGAPAQTTLVRLAVGPNQDGRLQVFAIGADKLLHTVWQQAPGGNWSAWALLLTENNPSIQKLAVGQNEDGRLEVFILTEPDGSGNVALQHTWQTTPNNGWSAWTDRALPSGQPFSDLAVVRDTSGCLQVVLTPDGAGTAQWEKQTAPGAGWTDWQAIGGPVVALSSPSLVLDEDGHLEVFALGSDGDLWHLWQTKGVWTANWASLGSPPLPDHVRLADDLVVGRNQDGRLEVFCPSPLGVYHIWQTAPNNGWSAWEALEQPSGGNLVGLAVICNQLGSLNLIGLAQGHTLWLNAQVNLAGANWGGWQSDWWSWYPLANQCWTRAEWVPLTIAPGGTSSNFWTIIHNGALINWNGSKWSTQTLPGGRGAKTFAVDTDGTVWTVAADGTFFRLANGAFEQLPGSLPGVNSLAASSSSSIWATAATSANEFALYTYRNGAWHTANTPQLRNMDWNNDPQVSVGRDGSVWLLDGSGNAWQQTMASASWSWDAFPAPKSAATITHLAAARGGGAWGVDSSGAIWQFKGAWSPFPHALPNGTAAEVSPGADGTLWAIDTDGDPYGYSSKAGWQSAKPDFFSYNGPLVQSPVSWAIGQSTLYQYALPYPNASGSQFLSVETSSEFEARQLSVGKDGSVWLVDTAGRLRSHSDGLKVVPGAPSGLVQIAVVDASRMWGIGQDPASKAYGLWLYAQGQWQQVVTSTPLFSATAVEPRLSSAGDGTVWLLDTSGMPHRLNWAARRAGWYTKDKSMSFQSISAVNVNDAAPTTGQVHEAWAVTQEGLFRRSFGNRWDDTHTSLPHGALASQVSVGTDGSIWALDASGNLYRKTASIQDPASVPAGSGTLAAGTAGGGGLHLFCLDGSGKPWTTTKRAKLEQWLDWSALSTTETFTSLVSGEDQDGTLEVFCLSSNGVAWHARQEESGWSALEVVGKAGQPGDIGLTQLATGRDQTSLLHLFALADDGQIYLTCQDKTGTGGWSDWAALPTFPGFLLTLATGKDPGGELEVFALDNSGIAHHSWRDSNSASGWSPWAPLGTTGQPPQATLTGLTTANDKNNPLYVFATGSDGSVYAIHGQPSGPAGWSEWGSLGPIGGGITPLALAAGSGPGGVFAIFAQGSDGAIYGAFQQAAAATGWSAWAPLGTIGTDGQALQAPVFGAGSDGVPHVFAMASGSVWQTCPLATAPTGWRDWAALSGRQAWQACDGPTFAQVPAGSADDLWAVGSGGSIQNSTDGGSSWKTIGPPGTSAADPAVGVSVGIDGTVWAVTKNGLYRHADGQWSQVAGQSFAQAPVGSANDLWTADSEGKIWRSGDGGATWWPETSYNGTARQLSMCSDGSIWLLDDNGRTALAPAWQRIMRPTDVAGFEAKAPVTEVVAGQDENGTRYVFFLQGGELYYTYELSHHAWPEPIRLGDWSNLSSIALTNQQDTGELIVYQSSLQALSIFIARKASGQRYRFAPAEVMLAPPHDTSVPLEASIGNVLELSAIDAELWYWFVLSGPLYVGSSAAAASDVLLHICDSPTLLTKLLRVPWPRNAGRPFCAVADGDGHIWMADIEGNNGGFSATFQALTGKDTAIPNGTILAAALLQADVWTPPQPRIYALAGDTQAGPAPALWMRCLTNVFASPADPSAWSCWTPLGGDYPGLANGPALAATDTLFTIGSAEASLNALQQNSMTGVWREGLVKRPSQAGDEILVVSTYQTETTIYDGNNVPEANVPVTIFAESPVEAWVNHALYPLDPGHGITVPSNAMGKLHVRMLAEGLHAPQLTFQAAGLSGPTLPGLSGGGSVTVSASQHVYAFLQGEGTLPVGGGQPTKLTPDALQGLNPKINSQTAKAAANGITAIAKMPGSNSASPEATSTITVLIPEHLLGGFFSHLWHDIKHGVESLVHAVEKGIVKAAVTVEKDAVTIAVNIGNDIVQTINLAVHTVEDAIHAIEIFVKSVIADIEEFIKWLMLLFDWEKILKTQRAIKGFIEQAVSVLQQQIGSAESKVADAFSSIQADLKKDFKTLIASGEIGGYTSFGDLPSSYSGASATTALSSQGGAGPALRQQAQPIPGSSSVHHNAFLNKVLGYLTPSFSIPAIAGVDPADFLDKLDVNNAISEIKSAAQDLEKFLKTLFTDPSKLASTGIVALLEAMESLLLALISLIEGLIEAFLGLIKKVVAGLLDVLQHSVDIPIISPLFKFLTGEDLTLLNLGTLIAAVPLYLLFELAFDEMPFTGLTEETASAPGTSVGTQWARTYLIFGVIYAIIAALQDGVTIAQTPAGDPALDPLAGFLAFCSIFPALGMQIAGWPDPNYFPNITQESSHVGTWIAIWFNFSLYFFQPLWTPAALGMPELGGDVQNVLMTIVGAMALISGIVAAIEGGADGLVNGPYAAEFIIDALNIPLYWLMVSEIREAIWEAFGDLFDPAILIFLIDLLVNIAGPIVNMWAN
jgi:hypothetical protein